MKNELGFDTSKWKCPEAGVIMGHFLHRNPPLVDMLVGSISNCGLWTECLRDINPDPLKALRWLRTLFDLPVQARERGQSKAGTSAISVFYAWSETDMEVWDTARMYYQNLNPCDFGKT